MNSFYEAIGFYDISKSEKIELAKILNESVTILDYYNNNNILPSDHILQKLETKLRIGKFQIMLNMGIYNEDLKELIYSKSNQILQDYKKTDIQPLNKLLPVFKTQQGKLYQGDCMDILAQTENNTFDLIFADPPFNLDKLYPSKMDDALKSSEYIIWTEKWLDECIRTLKDGGSLFIWNLPKWNTYFSDYLNKRLLFKHWISVDIKYSLPISGRLYPSHYSLLYYVKGERANVFKPDRLPMEICGKCFNELKDYGGYKNKMNPKGINMSDVWYDIPPVRHSKYKARQGANELSVKLMDRIIEMSTNPGDLVFDPFGGAGTTYITSEIKNRKWIGIEIGPIDDIVNRFNRLDLDRDLIKKYRKNYNALFPEAIQKKREEKGFWTCKTYEQDIELKTEKKQLSIWDGQAQYNKE